jgi:Lon protease-like protein
MQSTMQWTLVCLALLVLPADSFVNQHLHNKYKYNLNSLYSNLHTLPGSIDYLPIFPLRKILRLPSEPMTLNLYEPRYLALAQTVLRQPRRIYGALFSSGMPQMVSRGVGDVVPIVSVGDMGVVFSVEASEDDYIPTIGGETRRRIRLEARGIGRFRISKVVCTGFGSQEYDGDNDGVNNGRTKDLPFIVVSADMVRDEMPTAQERKEIDSLISDIQSTRSEIYVDPDVLSDDMDWHFRAEMTTFAYASDIIAETATQTRKIMLQERSTLQRVRLLMNASMRPKQIL